jgi:hypothetical protein
MTETRSTSRSGAIARRRCVDPRTTRASRARRGRWDGRRTFGGTPTARRGRGYRPRAAPGTRRAVGGRRRDPNVGRPSRTSLRASPFAMATCAPTP